jgi:hypothetical protein
MIFSWRSRNLVRRCVVLCLMLIPALSIAQEEAPAEETGNRIGNVYFSAAVWASQPVGTQYSPAGLANTDSTNNVNTLTSLEMDHGTQSDVAYEFEYVLPSNYGTLSYDIYKQEDATELNLSSPSDYIYQQSLSFDILAGFRNDGLADGVRSVADTRLREWKIAYSRPAFETPRIKGTWSVGWRRVQNGQVLSADYLSTVTGLPPFLPPLCDPCDGLIQALTPRSDTAQVSSRVEGRGIDVGFDVEMPLWKNKVTLEGGVSVSALRSTGKASYTSTNHYYTVSAAGQGGILCVSPEFCEEDYDLFNFLGLGTDNPFAFSQRSATITATADDISQSSLAIDTHVGFRWRTPYKRVEVFGGIKQSRYEDAAIELRPEVVVTEQNGATGAVSFAINNVDRSFKSVTYEGFFAGLRVRLY